MEPIVLAILAGSTAFGMFWIGWLIGRKSIMDEMDREETSNQ